MSPDKGFAPSQNHNDPVRGANRHDLTGNLLWPVRGLEIEAQVSDDVFGFSHVGLLHKGPQIVGAHKEQERLADNGLWVDFEDELARGRSVHDPQVSGKPVENHACSRLGFHDVGVPGEPRSECFVVPPDAFELLNKKNKAKSEEPCEYFCCNLL